MRRYRIDAKLGQGGFGAAYRAFDAVLDRACVVKELLQASDADSITAEQRKDMLGREASLLATLAHPGLPKVWDAFSWQGHDYLVMSFLEGISLAEVAKAAQGRMPESEVIRVAKEVGSILSYLEHQDPPIVHRDISPDNIICRADGGVSLLDFGAARLYEAGQRRDTVQLGKQGYAAPEAFSSQTDARSDLFSLGAVLYEISVDHDPSVTPFQFPDLSKSPLSSGLAAILPRLVAKREDRYQSADELSAALEALSVVADRCSGCRAPLPNGAWRCASCGLSLVPRCSWATIGGDGTHRGSVPAVAWSLREAWCTRVGHPILGGAVGADGFVVVASTSGSIVAMKHDTGAILWSRETAQRAPADQPPSSSIWPFMASWAKVFGHST